MFSNGNKPPRSSKGLQREIVAYLAIVAGLSLVIFGVIVLQLASSDGFRDLGRMGWSFLLFVGAFTTVLSWFGYRMIRYVVVSPLKEMERAAQAIAAGDPAQEVPIERDNEIGRLGRAIEAMRAHLMENQERLADYAQSLERLNAELEESQRALLRGEKLASVGRLASGIAHEVGNPLGAVLGYLALLKTSGKDPADLELIGRCESELTRISRIIRQLLDYARPHKQQTEPCNVDDLIRGTIEGVSGQGIPSGVTLRVELAGNLPELVLDPDPLRQVLWNLIANAIDAVGAQGRVTVRSERILVKDLRQEPQGLMFRARARKGEEFRPEILKLRRQRRKEDSVAVPDSALQPARGDLPSFLFSDDQPVIRIRVEDDGPGIPTEDIGKIFDPFFSTKPVGKGTGLGLFISLNLVQTMGGFLDVRTEVNRGSTFSILFPIQTSATQSLRG